VIIPVSFAVDGEDVVVWGEALNHILFLHIGDVVAFQARAMTKKAVGRCWCAKAEVASAGRRSR
jgi:hypothetical protein